MYLLYDKNKLGGSNVLIRYVVAVLTYSLYSPLRASVKLEDHGNTASYEQYVCQATVAVGLCY